MIRAVVLHFVRYVLLKSAILTFLMWKVLVLALTKSFPEIIIVALMLDKFVIFLCLLSLLVLCSMNHFNLLFFRVFFSSLFYYSSVTISRRLFSIWVRLLYLLQNSSVAILGWLLFGFLGLLFFDLLISSHLLFLRYCRHLRSLV